MVDIRKTSIFAADLINLFISNATKVGKIFNTMQENREKISPIKRIDIQATLNAIPVNGFVELTIRQVSKEVMRVAMCKQKAKFGRVFKPKSISDTRYEVWRIQ